MDLDLIRNAFDENFRSRGELGASVSLWREGREILSLAGGWRDRAKTVPWTEETLVLTWSITKALGSACLLHALENDGIELGTPVAALWPEFGVNGKESITLAQLLSHQSGLAAMEARRRACSTTPRSSRRLRRRRRTGRRAARMGIIRARSAFSWTNSCAGSGPART